VHLFSAGQPDWNWRNPAVGDYFDGVLRFWFDKGVDGLRIDVAHALFKAEGLPDSPSAGGVVDGLRSNPQVSDQEEVHEVYRRWRTLAEKYQPHRLLVGEVNLKPSRAARYTRADEMQQASAPPSLRCSACRARRTSTRARNSACPRSMSPSRPG
jgi:alpha-glucosidase